MNPDEDLVILGFRLFYLLNVKNVW